MFQADDSLIGKENMTLRWEVRECAGMYAYRIWTGRGKGQRVSLRSSDRFPAESLNKLGQHAAPASVST